jgi:glycosyltransferase involved in cell wall biosynthesis
MGSFAKFPLAVIKLKQFIKQHKIDMVHSHLFSATLVARLATPKKIPLITTIHTNVTASNDYKKWYIKMLEGISYKWHRSTIIGVSKSVLEQYFNFLHHTPYKKYLLYTFVDMHAGNTVPVPAVIKGEDEPFTLIAIGALRYPKNQQYLIHAFESLKNENFELHVYGDGVMKNELQQIIATTGVRVILKGEVKDASSLLPQYDLYVMPSEFEGFSLSVLEAMKMEMPMLLSDIPSFREQCEDTAMYFDLHQVQDFVTKLKMLAADKSLCTTLAQSAKQRVLQYFTFEHHIASLRTIYNETLNQQ